MNVGLDIGGDLATLRRAVRGWADERGVSGDDVGDLPVRVRGWAADRALVVEVHDEGTDPIPVQAGYRPPGLGGGRGLWLARQLADVLTTYTDGTGTTACMHLPVAPPPP